MNNQLRQFFAEAKKVSLSAAEKNSVRIALQNRHIQGMDTNTTFASAKNVALQVTEKSVVKSRLEQYMQMNPVGQPSFMRRFFAAMRNPFSMQALPATAVIIGILVSSTGGLTYAAESAVPGDSLYSLKVNVTEPAREAMAFTADDKARVHLWRMERRFQEVESLLMAEELNAERRAMLTEHMETHASFLEDRLTYLQEVQAVSAEEIEDDYAMLLEFHESAVERFAEEDGGQSVVMLQQIRGMRERRFGKNFTPQNINPSRLQHHIDQMEQHINAATKQHPKRAKFMREHLDVARNNLKNGHVEEAFRAARPKHSLLNRALPPEQLRPPPMR